MYTKKKEKDRKRGPLFVGFRRKELVIQLVGQSSPLNQAQVQSKASLAPTNDGLRLVRTITRRTEGKGGRKRDMSQPRNQHQQQPKHKKKVEIDRPFLSFLQRQLVKLRYMGEPEDVVLACNRRKNQLVN